MLFRTLLALACATALASPALADWTLQKQADRASAQNRDGSMVVTIGCNRRIGRQIAFNLTGPGAKAVPSIMMWIEMPDGRTSRTPIWVNYDGAAVGGTVPVEQFPVEFFRQGAKITFDMPSRGGEDLAVMSMKGTAAAWLAFQERCGL